MRKLQLSWAKLEPLFDHEVFSQGLLVKSNLPNGTLPMRINSILLLAFEKCPQVSLDSMAHTHHSAKKGEDGSCKFLRNDMVVKFLKWF